VDLLRVPRTDGSQGSLINFTPFASPGLLRCGAAPQGDTMQLVAGPAGWELWICLGVPRTEWSQGSVIHFFIPFASSGLLRCWAAPQGDTMQQLAGAAGWELRIRLGVPCTDKSQGSLIIFFYTFCKPWAAALLGGPPGRHHAAGGWPSRLGTVDELGVPRTDWSQGSLIIFLTFGKPWAAALRGGPPG